VIADLAVGTETGALTDGEGINIGIASSGWAAISTLSAILSMLSTFAMLRMCPTFS